jgi:hypothetical protein
MAPSSAPKSAPATEEKRPEAPVKNKQLSLAQEDLISFTPPQIRRQRSASTSLAFNPFTPQPVVQPPQVQPMGAFGTPAVPLQAFPVQQPSFNPFASQPSFAAQQGFGQSPFGQPQYMPQQGFGQQQYPQQFAQQQQQPTFNPFAPANTSVQGQQTNTPFSF